MGWHFQFAVGEGGVVIFAACSVGRGVGDPWGGGDLNIGEYGGLHTRG